ncbi:hypothetical protein [Streptomyces ossamyceticus]|uniref:hypothetical protein n=1 Tax=Streptomyces ossamyceticus TaxID=249581 RepID=UPI0034379E00
MSVPLAYTLIVIAVIGTAVCAPRAWRAWRDHHSQQSDVGPDALRLLQELDAHPDEYVLADPELAAGFDRLRTAIRDEQQKGGTD